MENLVSDDWVPDASAFRGDMDRFFTQSLFLEHGYDVEKAMYTFKPYDYEYKGKVYPSLRRLYVKMADPTEYLFANKYLGGWDHWQRIKANKALYEEIKHWEEELEIKLRALGVKNVIDMSGGNFTAAKWVADGHWNVRRGRPSKEEREREKALRERAVKEVEDDSNRIHHLVKRGSNA